jgi:hypothetical protein
VIQYAVVGADGKRLLADIGHPDDYGKLSNCRKRTADSLHLESNER